MLIDIIVIVLLITALIKGYRQGLIVSLFSFIAIIIGLAAAIKTSAVVAGYIGKAVKVSDEWLPVISFAVVFILVVLLVRWAAKAIEKTVEITMLGWVNRLGGMLFYIAIYITVFSVVLFYAEKIELIKPEAKNKSVTYSYVQPWGPKAINSIGTVAPFFKNMFAGLENFFGGVSEKIQAE
jgi:membrane protein required for colicin V production